MRTMQSEIIRAGLKQPKKNSPPPKQVKKAKEQFSRWEIEELMGVRRDRYERRNGAVRRK